VIRNIDFQSVGPAEFYFAETGEAGNMPAGRTGQSPVFRYATVFACINEIRLKLTRRRYG
jgi:hypothetical protein